LCFFGFFVEVLAVLLQLADGRDGRGGDLDQVDAEFVAARSSALLRRA
jgi:hypothetical protein